MLLTHQKLLEVVAGASPGQEPANPRHTHRVNDPVHLTIEQLMIGSYAMIDKQNSALGQSNKPLELQDRIGWPIARRSDHHPCQIEFPERMDVSGAKLGQIARRVLTPTRRGQADL